MTQEARHYTAHIASLDCPFQASSASPLLVSAAQANIALPASCRNGTCRTCMCMLVVGSVRYQIEWPGLTREEKAEGYILPCVAYPESDIVIDAPRAKVLEQG